MIKEKQPQNHIEQETTHLLRQLIPGHLSHELFVEMRRLNVSAGIEVVPLRINENNKVEVLLTKRSENDEFWPGELHIPGTIFIPGDTVESTFGRIFDEELDRTKISEPKFVNFSMQHIRRGQEIVLVHWVEVLGEPNVGVLYEIDHLPENTITHHIDIINLAADHFVEAKWNKKS